MIHGEEKFRRLLEAAPDGMVIVDRTGRMQLVNLQTERMFGYSREELLDRPVEILIPENFRQVIERAVILSNGSVLKIPPFEPVPAEAGSSSTSTALEDIEREHIIRVLREAKGKIGGPGGAAERLGMNRTTLNSRMQKLRILRKQF